MMYGINHGFAVAITLFEVMKRNWEYMPEKEVFLDAWGRDDLEDIGYNRWANGQQPNYF